MNDPSDLPDPCDLQDHAKVQLDRLLLAEMLGNIALEQAMLGAWHRNMTTGHFEVSDRLREIFGLDLEAAQNEQEIISRIHADYQPLVLAVIKQTLESGDDHDIEFPLSIPGKRNNVCVRATGKVRTFHEGGETYFIGTVMDVTAHRDQELRNQDFVQALTMELKTPLIAIAAYVQVLERKMEAEESQSAISILQKMQVQLENINAAMAALDAGKL